MQRPIISKALSLCVASFAALAAFASSARAESGDELRDVSPGCLLAQLTPPVRTFDDRQELLLGMPVHSCTAGLGQIKALLPPSQRAYVRSSVPLATGFGLRPMVGALGYGLKIGGTF